MKKETSNMSYTDEEIEKIMAEAVEYIETSPDDRPVYDMDTLVAFCGECQAENKNYFVMFKGAKIYTLLDDETSCYKKVTGLSKGAYELKQRTLARIREKHQREAMERGRASVPRWQEEGKKYMYPQKINEWVDYLDIRVEDFAGLDIEIALEIMKCLDENEDIRLARDILFERDPEPTCYASIVNMVTHYSKRGIEFYRLLDREPTEATERLLQKIASQNQSYKNELERR